MLLTPSSLSQTPSRTCSNTDYKSSEPLETLVMLCYVCTPSPSSVTYFMDDPVVTIFLLYYIREKIPEFLS